jgi:hypothetical protein
VHRLQAKEREHRLRAEKLEQLAASALESQVWLENVRDDKLFRKDIRPGVSPITRAYAIATIYFPELVDKVNELQQAARTAPGSSEAIWFESRRHGRLFQHGVVAFLGFGRRDVADGLQEPPVVEPVHPFQRRELDGF